MKKAIFFLALAMPILGFGQTKAAFEINAAPNYTYYTHPIGEEQGHIAYDFGLGFSSALKNDRWQWSGGVRFASYNLRYEAPVLRWGTQHDGMGGWNENAPSLEPFSSVRQQSNYFFLEMPFGLRRYWSKGKVKLFVQAAAGPAVFLTYHANATYTTVSGNSQQSIRSSGNAGNIRTVNGVAGLAAGIELPLNAKLSLQAQPHGDIQVLSTAKNSSTGARLYSTGLRLGIKYQL